MAHAALSAIPHGVMVVEAGCRVSLCNAQALRLLGLPEDLQDRDFSLAGASLDLDSLPVSEESDGQVAIIERQPGIVLKITARSIRPGAVALTIEDISASHAREAATRQAEAQYKSLFENSVYGIYRDTLDGRPVRCNPALAAMNGYDSETDYIAAVSQISANWYVDPGRAAAFRRLLERDGRVKDLVSEVYRHRSRDRLWVTENAWFVRDDKGRPLFIEGTIQDATERVQGLEVVERQANTDALTGAASRFRFLNCLAEETQPDRPGCVLYSIDLDHFKEVNDLLGHGAGDVVLQTVVRRLDIIAGRTGLVARLGGDEFAILQTGAHSHMRADTTAEAIVKAMRQPIAIEGHNVIAGCSVGVAVYPAQAASAEELLTNADLALYQVKTHGRNGFRLFGADLKTRLQQRKSLEQELRSAIAGDQLELHYQPIVNANTAAVVGYEALMRWQHPRLGFLPPSQFIPVAEDAGLMSELGDWAIFRACSDAALLPEPLSVSVNVSPNQFRSASILERVRSALAQTGLAPQRLILEMTESVILSSEAIASTVIGELQGLGIRLALDDFGTGYSSLSHLQRFAFSKVKIDRSFVAGIGGAPANLAIIRAIVALCRDLGIEVVAEGIETEDQAALLRHEKCQLLQGFLYGRPKSLADIAAEQAIALLGRKPGQPPLPADLKRTVHKAL